MLRANKSIEEFGAILQALGFDDTSDAETMQARIADRVDNTPEAAHKREALRKALELKDYEFNAHGVELGQRYASAAVIPDGTHDLAGHERFCLLTGISGTAWADAAAVVADKLGIDVAAHVIGPPAGIRISTRTGAGTRGRRRRLRAGAARYAHRLAGER